MTDLPVIQRCQGVKKSGEPCQTPATPDGFCAWHSPAIPDDVKTSWARAGGESHRQDVLPDLEAIALKHPKDAKKLLARMVKHVLGGSLTTSRANSAGFLLRVLAELEGLTRRKEDLHVGITVSFTTLNREGGENGQEPPPTPRAVASNRPPAIASTAGTVRPAPTLSDPQQGDPHA